MAEAMEIAPNDTIPTLPLLPGASPLVHIPCAGDGQTWPLASAGIAVAVAATPHPRLLIFRATTRGSWASPLKRRGR
jgi:hypothetical protein